MVKKLLFVLALALLLAPLTSATDTSITIKTIPYHEVYVTIFDDSGGDFTQIEQIRGTSDEYGDSYLTYSSDIYSFKIRVFVKKEGQTIFTKDSEEYIAGTPISFVVVPDSFEIIPTPGKNETEINDSGEGIPEVVEEVIDENAETGASITGAAITGENDSFLSTKTLYYVGGLFSLMIVVFLGLTVIKKRTAVGEKGERKIKIKKLSELKEEKKEMQADKKEKIGDYKDIIESAERKIKEAQDQIKELRDRGKISEHEKRIKEARKKLEEDEKALLKLRQEKD